MFLQARSYLNHAMFVTAVEDTKTINLHFNFIFVLFYSFWGYIINRVYYYWKKQKIHRSSTNFA